MKPNPGGIITGDEIIDREQEIQSIWKALQNQSVVITSERRIGKTCILRKMEANPMDEWHPVLYWVEGKQHQIEFVEGLYEELLNKGLLKDKFHNLKKLYIKYVGGMEIGSWKFPQIIENWKPLLESLIEDIVDSGIKVLLMLDELPLLLAKCIKTKEVGPLGCMDFLDTLRGLRNKYEGSKKISFIFCGSIGIHLVIRELKKNHGYNSDPTNNMKIISITGMDEKGANELCEKLAEDGNFQWQDKAVIFDYICRETDRLPFYIQHVFQHIYDSGEHLITKRSIDKAIASLLDDPTDGGYFRHYFDRIETYYDKQNKNIALLILAWLSKQDKYREEGDIIAMVKTTQADSDDELIKETLELLWSDHYLIRILKKGRRNYKFRYSILQKWWGVNKG